MLQEARSLPFVGERLAGKIEEIISSGGLRQQDAEDKEKQAVLSAFTKIHGVGQTMAQQFYAQISLYSPWLPLSGSAVGRETQSQVTACNALR